MKNSDNIVKFSIFAKYPNLKHGISTKHYNSQKEAGVLLLQNLNPFLKDMQIDLVNSVFCKQVHDKNIIKVDDAKERIYYGKDGLLTRQKNIFLGISTADCLPIIFYEPQSHLVSVIHAGYKGLLSGIIEETVDNLSSNQGDKEQLVVGVGPGIGVCCYNVPKERITAFKIKYPSLGSFYQIRKGKYFLNLFKITEQLLKMGSVKSFNIEILGICTSCQNNRFFSNRLGEKGRFLTIAGLV